MVNYRRSFSPGGTFFFTVNLNDRRSDLLVRHVGLLRESIRRIRAERPFHIDAVVILPEHMHMLWTLPDGDPDYSNRWRRLKGYYTQALVNNGVVVPRDTCGRPRLWQRRYWEHTIRDETDYSNHVNYIHYNPVKHGHVERVRDWPYSSFYSYVRNGVLPENWACGDEPGGDYGERQ